MLENKSIDKTISDNQLTENKSLINQNQDLLDNEKHLSEYIVKQNVPKIDEFTQILEHQKHNFFYKKPVSPQQKINKKKKSKKSSTIISKPTNKFEKKKARKHPHYMSEREKKNQMISLIEKEYSIQKKFTGKPKNHQYEHQSAFNTEKTEKRKNLLTKKYKRLAYVPKNSLEKGKSNEPRQKYRIDDNAECSPRSKNHKKKKRQKTFSKKSNKISSNTQILHHTSSQRHFSDPNNPNTTHWKQHLSQQTVSSIEINLSTEKTKYQKKTILKHSLSEIISSKSKQVMPTNSALQVIQCPVEKNRLQQNNMCSLAEVINLGNKSSNLGNKFSNNFVLSEEVDKINNQLNNCSITIQKNRPHENITMASNNYIYSSRRNSISQIGSQNDQPSNNKSTAQVYYKSNDIDSVIRNIDSRNKVSQPLSSQKHHNSDNKINQAIPFNSHKNQLVNKETKNIFELPQQSNFPKDVISKNIKNDEIKRSKKNDTMLMLDSKIPLLNYRYSEASKTLMPSKKDKLISNAISKNLFFRSGTNQDQYIQNPSALNYYCSSLEHTSVKDIDNSNGTYKNNTSYRHDTSQHTQFFKQLIENKIFSPNALITNKPIINPSITNKYNKNENNNSNFNKSSTVTNFETKTVEMKWKTTPTKTTDYQLIESNKSPCNKLYQNQPLSYQNQNHLKKSNTGKITVINEDKNKITNNEISQYETSNKISKLFFSENEKYESSLVERIPTTRFAAEETLIFFDWDDTLLPSSWLETYRFNSSLRMSNDDLSNLNEISECVASLIMTATNLGRVVIVTNAESGWVELSTSRYLPHVFNLLSSEKIQIISARSTYPQSKKNEHSNINSSLPYSWKLYAFQNIYNSNYLNQFILPKKNWRCNIISIGDSHVERVALIESVRQKSIKFPDYPHYYKSLKFIENSTPILLQRQLILTKKNLQNVVHYFGNLDLQIRLS